MRNSLLYPLALLLVLFFSAPLYTRAEAITQKNVSITISPERPSPGETYTLNLVTYSFDLNRSTITWSVNGKDVSSGIGNKSYSGVMGKIGETTHIVVRIEAGLLQLEKSVTIVGTDMDVIWETVDSYTPPFYKGKALPSPESRIKIVAIPLIQDGTTLLDHENITYAWNRNFSPDLGSSGYGKNSYIIRTNFLNPTEKIKVTGTAITKNLSATQSLEVTTKKPKILFYPIRNSVVDTAHGFKTAITATGDSLTVMAVPYFFSAENPDVKDLSYVWKVNNQQLMVSSPKNILTIQKGEATTGTIDLSVESVSKLLQSAKNRMTITFNK